ncbi:MAG: Mov34/MPN/PAD-1 family protein [Armatimonadetes bacterium]|nr:Mov34/MPN/PAD-1 family protein [Armatimonadota bacterium]
MNDDKSAEISGSDEARISLHAIREPSRSSGREIVVMVAESVLEEVRRHGQQDTSREQGGILVGTVASSQDKIYVNVEAVIAAPQTRAKRTSVTFTHDSWAHINQVKDSDYPDQDIVGWYHTHPGFGIFLSDYDTFIHRNFFPAAWQVALVLDPLSGESGFFVWKGNEIIPRKQYNVFSPLVAPAKPSAEPAPAPAPLPADLVAPPMPRSANILTAAALLVLALQVVTLIALFKGGAGVIERPSEQPAQLAAQVGRLEQQITETQARVEELDNAPPAASSAEAGPEYEWYEVRYGDSLWKIAREHYGDGTKYTVIAAENGIVLPRAIINPGQRLRLPKVAEENRGAQ